MRPFLLPFASESDLPAWTDIASGSLLGALVVFLVTGSIRGWITWPPEKKRMQDTIDLLTSELQKSNTNAQRALPTTARLVEVVEQRVAEPEVKISRADLIAALRTVASEGKKVVGDE